eukprot:scaffold650784_cov47-Prasinocladus_malaysianus.AAC.1
MVTTCPQRPRGALRRGYGTDSSAPWASHGGETNRKYVIRLATWRSPRSRQQPNERSIVHCSTAVAAAGVAIQKSK